MPPVPRARRDRAHPRACAPTAAGACRRCFRSRGDDAASPSAEPVPTRPRPTGVARRLRRPIRSSRRSGRAARTGRPCGRPRSDTARPRRPRSARQSTRLPPRPRARLSSRTVAPGSSPRRSGGCRRVARAGAPASPERRARVSSPGPFQASARARSRRARPAAACWSSVPPVALFLPWVAVVVVAVALPEPWLVLLCQLQAAHPLGALPEVEVRHEQPRRAAVLRLQRLASVFVGDPRLAPRHLLERKVRRVAAVAPRAHELPARLYALEQPVERHAGPGGVELRPLRDAVDVDRDRLARQLLELVPGPAGLLADGADDVETPLVKRPMRRRAGREHGEVTRLVLAGRQPLGVGVGTPSPEATGDQGHAPTFLYRGARYNPSARSTCSGVSSVIAVSTTSASASTSASTGVCAIGIAMRPIPAAFAARMPLPESSMATVASGAAPSRSAAAR